MTEWVTTTVRIPKDIHAQAREQGINISGTLQDALRAKVGMSPEDAEVAAEEFERKAVQLRLSVRGWELKLEKARQWLRTRHVKSEKELRKIALTNNHMRTKYGITELAWQSCIEEIVKEIEK